MLIKKRLYVDMDGVLVNFVSALPRLSPEVQQEFDGRLDAVPGSFGLMEPMTGAIEAYHVLADLFDTYILSRPRGRIPPRGRTKRCGSDGILAPWRTSGSS